MQWLRRPRKPVLEGKARQTAWPPGPQFARVAHGPDVGDPVACEAEREHGHGGAVLPGDQARLAIDRALEERHAGRCPPDQIGQEPRDLLRAFDGMRHRRDQAAAVRDRLGSRVQEASWRHAAGVRPVIPATSAKG